MRKTRRSVALLIAILFILVSVASALATDTGVQKSDEWQNFSFETGTGHIVARRGPESIILKSADGASSTLQEGVGPLYELLVTKTHTYTRHYGLLEERANSDVTLYFVAPVMGGDFTGPLTPKEFAEGFPEVEKSTNWQALRKAYKEALKSGRADYGDVDASLRGQLLFTLYNLHYIALYALLPGALIGFFFAKRQKRRPFIKGGGLAFAIILGTILLVALFGWLDLMYF